MVQEMSKKVVNQVNLSESMPQKQEKIHDLLSVHVHTVTRPVWEQ